MLEKEEEVLSVVASTWSDDNNAEGTDGYETVNELEDMEGDWEVIDEVGDSDEENGEPRMVIVRGSHYLLYFKITQMFRFLYFSTYSCSYFLFTVRCVNL
jgi:hypothetical protein